MSVIIDNLILSSISEILNNGEMFGKTKFHINAAQEVENKFNIHGMVHIDLNWYDSPMQDINENGLLFHLVKMMDGYLSCGKQVVVNCFAGVSRSTTVVLAYLMYKNKWSLEEALDFVIDKRPIVDPNEGFICQLYNIQDSLHRLDEDYNKLCANFENKTTAKLVMEIADTCKIPCVDKLLKRELTGFDMPENERKFLFFI